MATCNRAVVQHLVLFAVVVVLWQYVLVPAVLGASINGLKTNNTTVRSAIRYEEMDADEFVATLLDDEDFGEGSGFGDVIETATDAINFVKDKTLSCWKCNSRDNCSTETLYKCTNATKCFKFWMTDAYGRASWERGCLYESHKLQFLWCRFNGPRPDRIWHDDQMLMECCDKDLCNDGEIKWLPVRQFEPPPKDLTAFRIYLWISVGCLVLLAVIIAGVFVYCLCLEKKRRRQRQQESADPSKKPEDHGIGDQLPPSWPTSTS